MKIKLTKRVVEAQVPDAAKRLYLWDTEVTGFCVRVSPTGRRTYFLRFRNSHRQIRWLSFGNHGNITTEQARQQAVKASLEVKMGKDPAAAKAEQALNLQNVRTLQELALAYLERHAVHKRPKSVKEDKRLLAIILKALGKLPLKDVTRRDIEKLHLSQKDTPYQGNRILALLSKMFTLGISWKVCEGNPVLGIPRFQEHKKERPLQDEELERLWKTLDRYPFHPTSDVIKLLILTGARKGELLNATWEHMDLEKGIWTKPSHLTKQKKVERLPLSQDALEILKRLYNHANPLTPFVFPGKKEGQPLKELKTFWTKVRREAGLEDVRIHDLRHTYASHLVSQGLSLSIVGKLLGHTQAATTQRYAHLQDEPLRAATEMFGNKLRTQVLKA